MDTNLEYHLMVAKAALDAALLRARALRHDYEARRCETEIMAALLSVEVCLQEPPWEPPSEPVDMRALAKSVLGLDRVAASEKAS